MGKATRRMGAPRQAAKTHASSGPRAYNTKDVPHWNDAIAAMERKYEAEKAHTEQLDKRRDVADVGTAIYKAVAKSKPLPVPALDAKQNGFVSAAEFYLKNHVYLELTHKLQSFRLEFSLSDDLAPMAAANFRALCTGEKGGDLTYAGSKIHKISKGGSGGSWHIEGGDITKGDGTGGKCIYGKPFHDETNPLTMDAPGSLATAATELDQNKSLFVLNLASAPKMVDKGHVVFGKLVKQVPADALELMGKIECGVGGAPLDELLVAACGNHATSGGAAAAPGETQMLQDEDSDDIEDHEISRAVRLKAKRVRESQAAAVKDVQDAISFGMQNAKKKAKKKDVAVVQVPQVQEEEEEDVDLLGNDLDF